VTWAKFGLCWIALFLLAACDENPFSGHGCTEIGCGDGLAVTLRTQNNTWPAGRYAFEFTFDAVPHTCAIDLPDGLPAPGATAMLPCEPQLDAWFTPQAICPQLRPSDTSSPACTLIRDQWIVQVNESGTPDRLGVRVTRDAESLLDADERPKYETLRPNGPGCEPECENSRIELMLD
jgi:hypothetical protein